ncbi:MAG: transcription elongation factor GreA [Candidatus Jacksonbacteria bacterium]|nr:transcription elongation factor GreA [Candidatus Jacksonbacteria bacterium]
MDNNKFITPTGKQKLEEELEQLKNRRVEVAQKIKDAKELGDLSENAEYHAAKEEQGLVESRISHIESLLKSAIMVQPTGSKIRVSIGSKISAFTETGEIVSYEIVGINEAAPEKGKISAHSPIGNAFLGAKKGDVIEATAPAGKIKFTINEIH